MTKQTVSNLRIAGILFGGFLVNIPTGVGYYYGNLSTYIDSYYLATLGIDHHTPGSIWMQSLWDCFAVIGTFVSEFMSRKIGARLALLVGMVLFNVSLYISYFTLQSSFWSLHITLAILTGIGSGCCYSMTLVYAATWVKKRVGLSSSIVISAMGGGGLFFNLAATFYINPQNVEPDISVGESRYFSQGEIINRVPFVFFVIGALTTVCHVIAFPLMKSHPDFDKKRYQKMAASKSSIEETSCLSKTGDKLHRTEHYGTTDIDLSLSTDQHQKLMPDNTEERVTTSDPAIKDQTTSARFTLLKELKNKNLYFAGISLALFMIGFVIENSCYKQFGIVYIDDDYFLTNIGVGINIVTFFSRIFWGITLDMFSVKSVLVFVSFSHTILSVFWYLTPRVDRWFYLFWTLILQGSQSGGFIMYPICALKLFGHDNYMIMFGMMSSFGIIAFCATPALAQFILTELGWFWLFFFVSVISFISLILNLCLPEMS